MLTMKMMTSLFGTQGSPQLCHPWFSKLKLSEHFITIKKFICAKLCTLIDNWGCTICNRAHCDFTKIYWGPAHTVYKFKYAIPWEIPIFMQDGFYLIVKHLVDKFRNSDFNCSHENMKKYII